MRKKKEVNKKNRVVLALLVNLFFLPLFAQQLATKEANNHADKPLFRDPVYDGAADPTLIWNAKEKKWLMYYTNRRATIGGNGVSWIHGTPIGIAESTDGAHWNYKTNCTFNYGGKETTYWAPDVLKHKGTYHMYLTVVPGIFEDWKHPRTIIHLTSKNGINWDFQSELKLASERCIDASVFRLPDGTWRMYYNNEKDGKSIYYADSSDLYQWVDSGKKVVKERGEGPKVFKWKGTNWMVTDAWDGISVYSSDDCVNWKRQEQNILKIPGTGTDDQVMGGHPDVVVNGDKAYIFYFTHPGRTPQNKGKDTYETRRSSLQVAALEYNNGVMSCNRDQPVLMNLKHTKK